MRRFILLILLTLITAFSNPSVAVAQTAQELPNLTMKCLNATNIGTKNTQHFVKLDGTGFLPNSPVEIWRDTKEGFHCAIDANGVSLCSDSALSAKDNGREFQVLSATIDQIVADSQGEIHIAKVRSRTDARLQHRFYGAQKTPSTNQGSELPELSSEQYSLKLMTFLREQEATAPSEMTNCTTVFFDPYGRVFDTVSLEPIPQVSVWLLDTDKSALPNRPGVTNPNITGFDGSFRFYVDNGTYYLDPKTNTHSYPVTEAEITRLLGIQSVYYDLYRGEPIVQIDQIEHRDIPMAPLDPNNPTRTTPVIIDKDISEFLDSQLGKQKITGLVSHPKSVINIYSGTRLVNTVAASNWGVFEATVENSQIDQTLPLDLVAEKVPLINQTPTDVLGLDSQNQSEKTQLFPRPNFIIGFIYDQNNRIVPLSTIEITIPKMNNRIYAVAKADSNGFIMIPNQQLPPVDYVLKIKDDANKIVTTQSVQSFVTLNKNFLETEKINLLDPETNSVVKVVKTVKSQGTSFAQKYTLPTSVPTIAETQADTKQLPIYILLTFLVITAVGILLVFLYRFKSS